MSYGFITQMLWQDAGSEQIKDLSFHFIGCRFAASCYNRIGCRFLRHMYQFPCFILWNEQSQRLCRCLKSGGMEFFMNRTVLITGASRGIGRAAALKFAREGYQCVITCLRSGDRLAQVQSEIEAMGISCLSFLGDIGNYAECERLFREIHSRFDHIDILVNNAGIAWIGLFQDMSPSEWDRMMHTNLYSVYNTCRLAVPSMVSQHSGRIINVSSVWGISGASCEVAYSATKGAVNSFTRALAKELAPSNIQVNAVAFGCVDTEMNSELLDEDALQELEEEIPAGRLATADEAGEFIYHIATAGSYLTGQIIPFTGGWIV